MPDRTKPVPGADELASIIVEIRDVLDALEEGVPITAYDETGRELPGHHRSPTLLELMRMLAAARKDGYRSSTRPGVGAPATVYDDEGKPVPALSDPVGELVVNDRIADPLRVHAETVLRCLTGALGDLRVARGSLARSSQYMESGPGEPGCQAHAAVGEWVPTSRAGRCDWCYRFWLSEGVTPPASLLEAKKEGRRITEAMVREALSRRRGKRRRGAA